MMRSSNPAFNERVFEGVRPAVGAEVMTIEGTANKTMISLLIAGGMGAWAYSDMALQALFWPALILTLALFVAIWLKMQWAPYITPLYAAAEGLLLGTISAFYAHLYEGIVFQAVALTFGVLFSMLWIYRSGIIKVTDKFRIVMTAGLSAILLVYLATIILSFFGVSVPYIHGNGMIGIVFSFVVVGFASFSLLLDFDLIERSAHNGMPKYMEWYGAFALLVSLVWLYLEILRLLSKLQSRR